jgi:hypothetical protein
MNVFRIPGPFHARIAWPFGPCHLPKPLGVSQNRQKLRKLQVLSIIRDRSAGHQGPLWFASERHPSKENL